MSNDKKMTLLIFNLLLGLTLFGTYYYKFKYVPLEKLKNNNHVTDPSHQWNNWHPKEPIDEKGNEENISENKPSEPDVLLKANSFEEAIDLAKLHNKKVFIYFSSSNCGWCKKMNRTLADSEIVEILKSNVVMFDNPSNDLKNRAGITAYPSYMIVDSESKPISGSFRKGYLNEKDFKKWLKEYL